MNRNEIVDKLDSKSSWECSESGNPWRFINISDNIKVGKHYTEWAIFKFGKNQGFHISQNRKIPRGLIVQLSHMLN